MLTPWFWLGLTILFTVIEGITAFNLITLWFALSSLIMIFVSGAVESLDPGFRFKLLVGLFLGLSGLFLGGARPFAIKKLKVGKVRTNVHSLIGQTALVTKKITKFSPGEIKIRGQMWTALIQDDRDIEEGAECTIVKIEGVKAVVCRL
jgi:membrane protein implicated in regulation of membrane protease activity